MTQRGYLQLVVVEPRFRGKPQYGRKGTITEVVHDEASY
jgi:hypothetical protein